KQKRVLRHGIGVVTGGRHIGYPDAARAGGVEIHAFESRTPLLNEAEASCFHQSLVQNRHHGDHDVAVCQRIAKVDAVANDNLVFRAQAFFQQRVRGWKIVTAKQNTHSFLPENHLLSQTRISCLQSRTNQSWGSESTGRSASARMAERAGPTPLPSSVCTRSEYRFRSSIRFVFRRRKS